MSKEALNSIRTLFISRLDTLLHIVDLSAKHFEDELSSLLSYRLIDDMLPLGTQIAYTCNQPHNFTRWCEGKEMENLEPHITSVDQARQLIAHTKARLTAVDPEQAKLVDIRRIDLGDGHYIELPGVDYVNEFLIPNFYFHLVTAYNIMRMKGVALGKADYMLHLMPLLKRS